jgi:hypothetical protein
MKTSINREQQAQIKTSEEKVPSQEATISEQKLQIDAIKKALSEINPARSGNHSEIPRRRDP